MIKACIFDLDGTLLYTLDTIRFYVNRTLEKYGLEQITHEECRAFVGSGARVLIHRALLSRGVSDQELESRMLAEYMADYDSAPYHLTVKYEGVDELVLRLSERGIALAVLSNKPDFASRETVRRFFKDRFSLVCGGREGVPLKPDPTACLAIAREFSVSPRECAYIGDSDVDALTGKNMGAALNISVLWGFRTRDELAEAGAKLFASYPSEILDAIDKYNMRG